MKLVVKMRKVLWERSPEHGTLFWWDGLDFEMWTLSSERYIASGIRIRRKELFISSYTTRVVILVLVHVSASDVNGDLGVLHLMCVRHGTEVHYLEVVLRTKKLGDS